MPRLAPAGLLGLLALAVPAAAAAGGGPMNVLVLFAADLPEAAAVAAHYARARALPDGHLCPLGGIDQGRLASIPFDEYERLVLQPLDACLAALPLPEEIDYLVTVRGLPYRVELGPDGYVASLEAVLQVHHATRAADGVELAGLPQQLAAGVFAASIQNPAFDWGFTVAPGDFTLQNPYASWYGATSQVIRAAELPPGFRRRTAGTRGGNRFDGNLFVVSRLDGFDFADADALVDRGVLADGAFPAAELLCMEAADEARGARDPECELATRMLAAAGFDATFLAPFDGALAGHELAAYLTGAADLRGAIAGNGFARGAFADLLTSLAAEPTNFTCSADGLTCPAAEAQTSVARFVRAGATFVHGAVAEPLNNVFPNAAVLLFAVSGYGLGESFLFSQRFLHWQNLHLGDPLATPFARRPEMELVTRTGAAVPTDVRVRATHANGIARVLLYMDGALIGAADGDALSMTLPGTDRDPHDLLAVGIARNVPVRRPGWPIAEQLPQPDVQGWVESRDVPGPGPGAGGTGGAGGMGGSGGAFGSGGAAGADGSGGAGGAGGSGGGGSGGAGVAGAGGAPPDASGYLDDGGSAEGDEGCGCSGGGQHAALLGLCAALLALRGGGSRRRSVPGRAAPALRPPGSAPGARLPR